MNALGWDHWSIIAVDEINEHDLRITAELGAHPRACLHRGSIDALSKYGIDTPTYHDLPVRGERVGLVVRRQRYICKECG